MTDQPQMQCPNCGKWEDDFDGFGMLAHTKPAYPEGCGYCSHPAIDDGVCGICGGKEGWTFCTHDAEPDYCDGCLYIRQKAGADLRVRVKKTLEMMDLLILGKSITTSDIRALRAMLNGETKL